MIERYHMYIIEQVGRYYPNKSLHSEIIGLLTVPRVYTSSMGGRAFRYQTPHLWNQLPVLVQKANTLYIFLLP